VVERIEALGGSAQGLKTQVEAQALLERLEEAAKPRLVAAEGEIVGEAQVRVAPSDPNVRQNVWFEERMAEAARKRAMIGPSPVVTVKPGGAVRVDMEAYERQRELAEQMKREDRRRRRELDPCNLGIYGSWDDE
jgi:hypothetical protein